MKKRFFNALILGAVLLSTGAVTSCKDYDDDISNLQEQVNKLSQLESLKTDVATLQSAVKTAQDDATKALADAKAASDKAAATADQVKAVQAAIDAANELIAKKADKTEVEDLQKLVNEYKDNLDKLSADAATMLEDAIKKSALASEVAELKKQVEAITNPEEGGAENLKTLTAKYNKLKEDAEKLGISVSTMITDIQLYNNLQTNGKLQDFDEKLDFLYIAEKANYTWYKDLNKGITELDDKEALPKTDVKFKEGGAYFGADSIVVRVSPATAILKAENISFINTQGKSLDGIVEVDGVHPYEGLKTVTRANASATGLWVVKVKPATTTNAAGDEIVDIDAFKKATISKVEKENNVEKTHYINYALAVKNFGDNTEADETRRVTSEYDLYAGVRGANHAGEFTVNGVKVSEIHNRYMTSENGTKTEQPEMTWLTGKDYKTPSSVVLYDKDNQTDPKKTNVNLRGDDNRNGQKILPVEIGKDITIDFTPAQGDTQHGGVKGFFVVLDERNAVESNPSELRAWRSYDYTGVGYTDMDGNVHNATYFEGNKGVIRVDAKNLYETEVIGFRVYAVNYDGTLVDPDGQAFYAILGNEVSQNDNKFDVKYSSSGEFVSALIPAADFLGADYKKIGANGASEVTVVGKDADNQKLKFVMTFYKDDKGTDEKGKFDGTNWNVTSWDDINYVKISFKKPGKYIDGAEYTQSFYMTKVNRNPNESETDVTPTVNLRKITVTGKKVMPTAPTYGFKSGQDKYQWLTPYNDEDKVDFTVANNFKTGDINLDAILLENAGNGWNNLSTEPTAHFKFTVATSKWKDADNGFADNATADNTNWIYSIAEPTDGQNKYIVADNKTSHAVSAKYIYKEISKRWDDKAGKYKADQDYEPTATSDEVTEFVYCSWTKDFKTVETNWTAEPIAWDSKTGAVTKTQANNILQWYNVAEPQKLNLDKVKVTSDLRGLGVNAKLFKDKSLGELIASNLLDITEIKLHGSKGDKDTYFDVANANEIVEATTGNKIFTVINCTKKADVQSPVEHTETLSFKVRDCFGNKYSISLPVTVKP